MFCNETKIKKKLFGNPNICDYISKVGHELVSSINYVIQNLALEKFYLHKISTRPSAQGKNICNLTFDSQKKKH
jgi:hypothetical protein